MSNEPTKVTDRWKIGKSNLLYNLVYLLAALTVSHLFNLTFVAAVLWCLPLIPAWLLLQKRLKRKKQYEYSQHEYTQVAGIYDCSMDYPGRDNWADSVVRLASYKSSNSRYPVLLDHIYNWATQWGMVLERRDQGNVQMCFITNIRLAT